jgi:hypothetical protein
MKDNLMLSGGSLVPKNPESRVRAKRNRRRDGRVGKARVKTLSHLGGLGHGFQS